MTQQQLRATVDEINERISQMATQADIDAITQQVGQVAADLDADVTKIQTELDALAAANPTLDLTALQTAVAPLDAKAQALGELAPTPPG